MNKQKLIILTSIILLIALLMPSKSQGVEVKKEIKIEPSKEIKYISTIEKDILDMPIIEEPKQIVEYETRMTSYYSNDGYNTGSCTGSGLCENDFEINENGWYTYQGKLVIATATDYLLNYGFELANGVHTYRYYDEITLNIDGINYQAIILDSCGSSMQTDRIDLFVSNAESVKDTIIKVEYEVE